MRAADTAAEISAGPVHGLLAGAAARFADRPAIHCMGRGMTYAELADAVGRASAGLRRLGVGPGVKVGLCLPNLAYAVICYYAILRAGGTVVNYNPLYVERELEHQIEDSGTEIMVTLDLKQIYPKVAAQLGHTCLRRIVVCPMGDVLPAFQGLMFRLFQRSKIASIPHDDAHVRYEELIAPKNDREDDSAPASVDPEKDIAVLQYTGGTTGVPKGAMLTHANLTANASQIRAWCGQLSDGDERVLGVLPLFHVFGMTSVMNLGIATGAELILMPRFNARAVLKSIERQNVTFFMGVPTIFHALNDAPEFADYDLSSLKYCISGGAPLPADVKARFEAAAGCPLVEGYGLTECSPVVTCNPFDGSHRENSAGKAIPGTTIEIRTPEPPYDPLPQGGKDSRKGEVCIRGPQVMAGYWRNPEATAKSLIDGRFHTGDIGYVDADGYLYLVDRLKDVILCGGYNVYPRVIEDAIQSHESVRQVTVIGVPDEYRGEAPKAFVVLKAGAALTADELLTYLKGCLSPIEMPDHIEFRDELPVTTIGKLSKKELAAEEEARRSAQEKGNSE